MTILKVLSDLGIIGLVLYLYSFIMPILLFLQNAIKCKKNVYTIMALSGGLSLMVFSLTDNVITYSTYLYPLVYILFPFGFGES